MRKISSVLLATALCVLVVISCKKDDPAPPAYIGSWLETGFTAAGCTDPGDNEVNVCAVGTCETITFTVSTITILKPGSPAETYNFTASGSTLTVTIGSDTFTATVTVSGTTLTIVSEEDNGCTNTSSYSKI